MLAAVIIIGLIYFAITIGLCDQILGESHAITQKSFAFPSLVSPQCTLVACSVYRCLFKSSCQQGFFSITMRIVLLLASACLLLVSLGCTSATDKASANDETPTTFDTPEACWEAMAEAKKNNDAVATLPCLSEKDRNLAVGSLAYEVERLVMFNTPLSKQAEDLLKRYELNDVDIIGALQLGASPGGIGPNNVLSQVGGKVKDQQKFAKEASELLESIPRPGDQKPAKSPELKLANVVVEGDTASGEFSVEGSPDPIPIQFVREDGSWKISTDPKAKKVQP